MHKGKDRRGLEKPPPATFAPLPVIEMLGSASAFRSPVPVGRPWGPAEPQGGGGECDFRSQREQHGGPTCRRPRLRCVFSKARPLSTCHVYRHRFSPLKVRKISKDQETSKMDNYNSSVTLQGSTKIWQLDTVFKDFILNENRACSVKHLLPTTLCHINSVLVRVVYFALVYRLFLIVRFNYSNDNAYNTYFWVVKRMMSFRECV